jgi:hypothetical protein
VRQHESVIRSLLVVADADPPFWPRVVDVVSAAMSASIRTNACCSWRTQRGPVRAVDRHPRRPLPPVLPVRRCRASARARQTPAAPTELLDFLRGKVTDGRHPPWTEWWDEDVAPLFPDAATRAAVTAEELRVLFAYYEQSVPVPAGWDDDVACGYLFFGPPYEVMAADARSRGWLVEELAGQHLHHLVDPEATADRLITMADSLALRDT